MVVCTYYKYRPLSFYSLTALLYHEVTNENVLVNRYIADMCYILVRKQGLKSHEVKRFTDILDGLYHFKKASNETAEDIINHLLQKGGNG